MHPLQKLLLSRLKQQNHQRYATFTNGYDFEDNIVFHINQLTSAGYITRTEGIYSITLTGIKEISQFEPLKLEDKGVKSFFIGFLCNDERNNYLLKSHPNAKANFYNLPNGKPFFGETIDTALVRLFHNNTGLLLSPDKFRFTSLHLKTIVSTNNEVIFDDAFTIYSVTVDKEQKSTMELPEFNEWYSLGSISEMNNRWPEIDICILRNDLTPYRAYTHISDYIL